MSTIEDDDGESTSFDLRSTIGNSREEVDDLYRRTLVVLDRETAQDHPVTAEPHP